MKKVSVIIGALSLFFASVIHAEPSVIKFVTLDREYFPYIMGNSKDINKANPGTYVEFLKLLEKKIGIRMTLARLSYSEIMTMVSTGDTKGYDGYIAAYYTADRDRVGAFPMKDGMPDYSKSLYIDRYYFYKNKKSPVKWNGVYLTDIKMGITAAAHKSILEELKLHGYKYKDAFHQEALTEVAKGSSDVALCNVECADYYLAKHPEIAKNIEKLKPEFTARPFFIAFSEDFEKKNPELAKRIWLAVEQMRGDYMRLEEKYLKRKNH
jgi:polar amino acid transport system substrate-binding protein